MFIIPTTNNEEVSLQLDYCTILQCGDKKKKCCKKYKKKGKGHCKKCPIQA